MGHIRESVHIDAPVDAAWKVGRDATRMPEWNTTAIEVKDVTGPLEQVGSQVTVVSKVAGRLMDVTWRVERVEPPHVVELSGSAPRGGQARQRVEYEAEAGGTRVTVDMDYELPMGFLGEMLDKLVAERMVARDVRHSSENFKALVEEEAAVLAGR
jgi:uncharacterized membrane protein